MSKQVKKNDQMEQMQYLVDGEYLTEQEIINRFGNRVNQLSRRQRSVFNMVKKVIDELEREAAKYADIGCYFGYFTRKVVESFPHLQCFGIDYFPDNIRIANLLHENGVKYLEMSVYDLDFPDQYFDFITFQEVIEHIDRPVDAVREINRVLKSGGYLIISTPNAVAFPNIIYNIFREYRNFYLRFANRSPKVPHEIFFENVEWNRHIYAWSVNTLSTLLLSNGFEYVEHRMVANTWWLKLVPGIASELVFLVKRVASAGKKII